MQQSFAADGALKADCSSHGHVDAMQTTSPTKYFTAYSQTSEKDAVMPDPLRTAQPPTFLTTAGRAYRFWPS